MSSDDNDHDNDNDNDNEGSTQEDLVSENVRQVKHERLSTKAAKSLWNDADLAIALGGLALATAIQLQVTYLSTRIALSTVAGFAGSFISLLTLVNIDQTNFKPAVRDDLRQKFLTFLFSSASAGVVVNALSTADLIVLNTSGAFFDALFRIVVCSIK